MAKSSRKPKKEAAPATEAAQKGAGKRKAAKKTARKKAAPAPTPAKVQVAAAKATVVRPSEDEIRRRAREIWEKGGRRHGTAHQDWVEAERQLLAERGLAK